MKLKDLITDFGLNRLSHTKLWANVAYATGTGAVALDAYRGTLNTEIFLGYLAIVGASSTASKLLSLRYSANKTNASE